ncbi:hypothetical protein Tco_0352444 [Tanacetum coccineum]
MSFVSSVVTYTSVYTDFESRRVFWGANEEISDGGSPRVITPPVPQDEDEREAMFIKPHDADYMPEHIYPEYIPLEDEHEFSAKEQPLPPVVSPTAKLPGYVNESDPEEDLEEDDADDEGEDEGDEDDEDEEEEVEHLDLADSAIVVPTVELVSPHEGTKPVIPPPSTDITTTGARIIVRL